MESRRVPNRPIVLVMAFLSALALAVTAWSTLGTQPATHAGTVITSGFPGPDARERNDALSAAMAARASESADAGDRNAQLTYSQMLAKFNDKSPDAQERNILISGR